MTRTTGTRWLKMGQAMKLLGVCRKTLRRYIIEGHVTAERLPSGPRGGIGHWRIKESSIRSALTDTEAKALRLAHKHGII